jgi:hypothetical protein
MNYRITKYSPSMRDASGVYTDHHEWTCISEINTAKLAVVDYLEMESKYCDTIQYLLKLHDIKQLTVKNIELPFGLPTSFFSDRQYFHCSRFRPYIRNGSNCNLSMIEIITRLCLRDDIWCMLVDQYGTYLHYGQDYYTYFGTPITREINKKSIPPQIYVELYDSPYLK